MGEVNRNLKDLWVKGMEAIGRTASNIASNTKYKVDEMNLLNRRREILSDFGAKAYALWLQGESFPEELEKQLEELKKLDEQLNDMRAERYTGKAVATDGEEAPGAEDAAAPAAQEPGAEPVPETEQAPGAEAVPEEEADGAELSPVPPTPCIQPEETVSSVGAAIDDLFDGAPSVDEMAEKVNQSLEKMDDHLKKFEDGSARAAESLTDRHPEQA